MRSPGKNYASHSRKTGCYSQPQGLFTTDINIHHRWSDHKWSNETSLFTPGFYLHLKCVSFKPLVIRFQGRVYFFFLLLPRLVDKNYCFRMQNILVWILDNALCDLCCCMLMWSKLEKFCESKWSGTRKIRRFKNIILFIFIYLTVHFYYVIN